MGIKTGSRGAALLDVLLVIGIVLMIGLFLLLYPILEKARVSAKTTPCWTVTGSEVRTIDGDTFEADLAIWHGLTAREKIRVLGVDTPELNGPNKAAAEKAKDFTQWWLMSGEFVLHSCKRDSFGRVLAEVTMGKQNLADELIKSGLGKSRR